MDNSKTQIDATAFFLAFQSLVKQAVHDALAEQTAQQQAETQQDARPPATRKEAAAYLGISLPTLDTLIKTKQINAFHIGSNVRITWAELERYVADKESAAWR